MNVSPPDDNEYSRARTVAGLVLLGVVGWLFLAGRPIEPIELGLLLGTGLLLLGVEGGKRLIK